MSIALVDFEKTLAKYEKVVKASKDAGSFERDGKVIDPKLVADLEKLVKVSIQHTDSFEKEANLRHKISKGLLEQMMALAKKAGKNITDDNIEGLSSYQRALNDQNRVLANMSAETTAALIQFRGKWDVNASNLLLDASPVDAMRDRRMKSIQSSKQANAMVARVGEYADRGADVMKMALKLQKQRQGESDRDDWQDGDDFLKELNTLDDKFTIAHNKAQNLLKKIAALDVKTKLDAKALALQESLLVSGRADAKTARGYVKTLDLKVEVFKKGAKKADANYKMLVDAYLKQHGAKIKDIGERAKALEKLEDKADSVFAKVQKLK